MQFITQVFLILFPLCSIASCGYLYARYVKLHAGTLNELVTNFFMPVLLFHTLAIGDFRLADYGLVALLSVAIVLGSGLVAWPAIHLSRRQLKTFLPPMMFSNAGSLGLPIAFFAFGEVGLQLAAVFFVVESCLHVTLVYYIMGRRGYIFIFRQPFIIAVLAAMIYWAVDMQPHPTIMTTLQMLTDVALPLLIFTLGARLRASAGGYLRDGLFLGVWCPLSGLVTLMFCFLVLRVFDLALAPSAYQVLLLAAILPPAISNFIFAEKFNQEPAKVASSVVVSNLMSLVTVPILFYFIL